MRATSTRPAFAWTPRARLRATLSRSIFGRATPEIASPSNRRDFGGGHGFGHAGPSLRARPPRQKLAGGQRGTRLGADDARTLVLRAARAALHGDSACSIRPGWRFRSAHPTSVEQNGLTLAITRPLTPGRYSVVWRTAASDGHATNGNFSFRVAARARRAAAHRAPSVTVTPVAPSTPTRCTASRVDAGTDTLGGVCRVAAADWRGGLQARRPPAGGAPRRRLARRRLAHPNGSRSRRSRCSSVTTVARVALQSQLVAGSSSPIGGGHDRDHRHAVGTRLADGGARGRPRAARSARRGAIDARVVSSSRSAPCSSA